MSVRLPVLVALLAIAGLVLSVLGLLTTAAVLLMGFAI